MRQVLILIAEDENRLAAFVEKGLKKSGFDSIVAADGLQALNVIQREPIDLLLLDLGLPIKNGWEVLQEARSLNPDLPIIVVTALTDDRDRQRVLQAGANDYLSKPFRFSDLLAKVNLYLAEK
ncbi:MAG: response regulator [Synechococcales cyanobacterium CRU_2_2]|nr:response regulator [Synechococcales cyanobacterium CRU_2_2]